MTQLLEIFSFTKVFAAALIILLLRSFYNGFIKPGKQLKRYSQVPGSIITLKLGTKDLKTWSNIPQSNFKPDPTNPFSSSKLYQDCFKYPKQRLVATNFLNQVVLNLTDPKLIGEFFKNGKYYIKKDMRSFLRTFYTRYGIGGTEGEEWKFQRKIIAEAFHFENLAKTVPLMEETVKEFLDNIEFKTEKEAEINIIDEFQKITGEIVGRTFFGQNLNEYKLNGRLLTLELADILVQNSSLKDYPFYHLFGEVALLFSPKLRKIRNQTIRFGEFSKQLVRESIKKIERGEMGNEAGRKGLLQILVEKGKTEKGLSEKELVANFITFFVAGMDTTGHTAGMAVYFLSQYPEVKEKLINEIDSLWDGKAPITLETMQKMEYMHAFLEETLRMATPAPSLFPRIAVQDHYLKDILVKKGTTIMPVFTPSMFSEEFYTDPCTFKPERWIKGSESCERPNDPFAFIPFSSGARNCIGQHMSLMEAKLILCHFLKRYEFRLVEGYKLEMVRRFLAEPKEPMKFVLSKKIEDQPPKIVQVN